TSSLQGRIQRLAFVHSFKTPTKGACHMSSGEDVLGLAVRHGGVTVEAVHRILLPKLSVKSAEKAIAEARPLFRAIPFDGKKAVYVLNRRGRRMMDLPLKKGSEGERVIIFLVVALNFFAANRECKRFSSVEFARKFPELVVKGIDGGRYF